MWKNVILQVISEMIDSEGLSDFHTVMFLCRDMFSGCPSILWTLKSHLEGISSNLATNVHLDPKMNRLDFCEPRSNVMVTVTY